MEFFKGFKDRGTNEDKSTDRMQIFRGEQKRVFFKFSGGSAKFVHTNARSCNLNRDEKLSLAKNRHEKEK